MSIFGTRNFKAALALFAAALCAAPAVAQLSTTHAGLGTLVSYQGPGDVVSGAIAFYSFRAYSAATVGTKAYRLLRTSDSTQTDINSLASGLPDVSTPTTFCNATNCHIVTFYDQSGGLACGGSACDVTQATDAQRLVWTASSLGGFPCGVGSVTSNTGYASSGTITQAQPMTFFGVAERTANTGTTQRIVTNAGATANFSFRGANLIGVSGGTAVTQSATDNAFHAGIGVLNSPGGAANSLVVVDGSAGSSANANTGTFSANAILIGGDTGTANSVDGVLCEAGLYPAALNSTQYGNLNTNMHSATNGWNF